MSDPQAARPSVPAKDPLKSFRGVMAGSLIMEGIVVALALPIVATLGSGIDSVTGWLIIAIAVALVACCGFLSRRWIVPLILALHVGLIAFFYALPAVAVIGLLFLAIWLWLLWLRRDVRRRMAEGRLPSQQQTD